MSFSLSKHEFRTALVFLHVVVAVVHAANGIAGLVIQLRHAPDEGATVLYDDRPDFSAALPAGANQTCGVVRYGEKRFAPARACSGFEWDGLLALVVSEFITSAFHIAYAIEMFFYLRRWHWFNAGAHSLRWVEYGVTATIYSLANLFGVGARSAHLGAVVAASLLGLQLCGLIAEYARAGLNALNALDSDDDRSV